MTLYLSAGIAISVAVWVLCRLTVAGREIDRLRRKVEAQRAEHERAIRHLQRPVIHRGGRYNEWVFEGKDIEAQLN